MNCMRELTCAVFRLSEDDYALNIEYITEITKPGALNALPEMPPYMLGLFRFRHRVVPLIDLKARLGLAERARPSRETGERIIVVNDDGRWIGFKVDAVHEIANVPVTQAVELKQGFRDLNEAIDGVYTVDDRYVVLLKFQAVVDPDQAIDLSNWKEAVGM